jgi:hypothetical protein
MAMFLLGAPPAPAPAPEAPETPVPEPASAPAPVAEGPAPTSAAEAAVVPLGEPTPAAPPEPEAEEAPPAPAPEVTTTRTRGVRREWPERPIRWRLDGALASANGILLHPSYLGFDDDRRLAGLDATVRLDYRAGDGRIFLGGGLTYRRASTSFGLYDGPSTSILVHEPGVVLRGSWSARDGIDPYVEVAGGPTIAAMTVYYAPGDARQTGVTGFGSAVAGTTFYLPKRWLPRRGSSRVSAGFDLGLGYAFRGDLAVQPQPDLDPDEYIDTTAAPLGTLVTRGLTWRIGLFVRFM